jgi:hypothetical protein
MMGTVVEYLWANPHTNITLQGADASGGSGTVVLEAGPAIAMHPRYREGGRQAHRPVNPRTAWPTCISTRLNPSRRA